MVRQLSSLSISARASAVAIEGLIAPHSIAAPCANPSGKWQASVMIVGVPAAHPRAPKPAPRPKAPAHTGGWASAPDHGRSLDRAEELVLLGDDRHHRCGGPVV